MSRKLLFFLGLLATMGFSWAGIIVLSQIQFGRSEAVEIKNSLTTYPTARPGLAEQGRQVYRAMGCAECHTQQVRPGSESSDMAWGWGTRRTVAQDYLYDQPVLPGVIRLGPDLANIADREPERFASPWQTTDPAKADMDRMLWHLKHLFNPRSVAPASMMPAYRALFIEREVVLGIPASLDAIGKTSAGHEIIPTPSAKALVAYLLSLQADAILFETPVPSVPYGTGRNFNSLGGGGVR
jgi:cytochrome c oxidase cbb3-type subunit 2